MHNMLAAKAIADAVRTSLGTQAQERLFRPRSDSSAPAESRRMRRFVCWRPERVLSSAGRAAAELQESE